MRVNLRTSAQVVDGSLSGACRVEMGSQFRPKRLAGVSAASAARELEPNPWRVLGPPPLDRDAEQFDGLPLFLDPSDRDVHLGIVG